MGCQNHQPDWLIVAHTSGVTSFMPDCISHRGFFLWNTSLPRCIWFPHGIAPRMA
jgi:hypothetical protein